jgi:hypothetical protein
MVAETGYDGIAKMIDQQALAQSLSQVERYLRQKLAAQAFRLVFLGIKGIIPICQA